MRATWWLDLGRETCFYGHISPWDLPPAVALSWPAGFTHLTSENHVELRGLVWLLAEEWGPGFPGKVPALPRRPRCDQLLVPWEHEVS